MTLATQFEHANAILRDTIAALTPAAWQARCPGEGWSVGVTAHHIVACHEVVLDFVQRAAAGESLPALTLEQMNAGSAEHARENATCTQAETLALLHETNQSGTAILRALTDAHLRRTIALPERDLSLERAAMDLLIGHIDGEHGHLASMRAACAATAAAHPIAR